MCENREIIQIGYEVLCTGCEVFLNKFLVFDYRLEVKPGNFIEISILIRG